MRLVVTASQTSPPTSGVRLHRWPNSGTNGYASRSPVASPFPALRRALIRRSKPPRQPSASTDRPHRQEPGRTICWVLSLLGVQMSVKWPPLVVRSWQGILYGRDRESFEGWDHDPEEEATISRRMHELRGLVVGQVAEIESALLDIASEIRGRHPEPLPNRQKRKGAGGALNDVRKLLPTLSVGDGLARELALIDQVIRRRNRLMHARIHVGFIRLGPRSGLEPVIYLLLENDAR